MVLTVFNLITLMHKNPLKAPKHLVFHLKCSLSAQPPFYSDKVSISHKVRVEGSHKDRRPSISLFPMLLSSLFC